VIVRSPFSSRTNVCLKCGFGRLIPQRWSG
jgi:ribosomal protein L37E